jgi:hypothetical protein
LGLAVCPKDSSIANYSTCRDLLTSTIGLRNCCESIEKSERESTVI